MKPTFAVTMLKSFAINVTSAIVVYNKKHESIMRIFGENNSYVCSIHKVQLNWTWNQATVLAVYFNVNSQLTCGNLKIPIRWGNSQIVYLFRLVYNSTRSSLQAYVSLALKRCNIIIPPTWWRYYCGHCHPCNQCDNYMLRLFRSVT